MLGYSHLKPTKEFLSKNNYACPMTGISYSSMLFFLASEVPPLMIVMSPLIALMMDQVESFINNRQTLKARSVSPHDKHTSMVELVYMDLSPELSALVFQ